jgi:hypothetical protein
MHGSLSVAKKSQDSFELDGPNARTRARLATGKNKVVALRASRATRTSCVRGEAFLAGNGSARKNGKVENEVRGHRMRHVLLLLLTTASCAYAQTPQQLLQLAQDTYTSPEGYQINGKGSVQPLGSSWQINFDVKIAAAPSPSGDQQLPANSGSAAVGHLQFVNMLGGADEKPTSLNIPLAVAGFWNRIAKNVDSVTETGSETLPLNEAPTACRVLQVVYKAPADAPKPSPVTYSICSDRHLVLKKVMLLPIGRDTTDPPVPWTITFDTAEFNHPSPQ